MKESAVEKRLCAGVKRRGGWALKFVSPGAAGVPDRIVIMPGKIYFVELKTETGTRTQLQIAQQDKLRALGMDVRTLYGAAQVKTFLDELAGDV